MSIICGIISLIALPLKISLFFLEFMTGATIFKTNDLEKTNLLRKDKIVKP